MRIKIVSDGLSDHTDIIDVATGERLEGVVSVKWEAPGRRTLTRATIVFEDVPIDAVGETTEPEGAEDEDNG